MRQNTQGSTQLTHEASRSVLVKLSVGLFLQELFQVTTRTEFEYKEELCAKFLDSQHFKQVGMVDFSHDTYFLGLLVRKQEEPEFTK